MHDILAPQVFRLTQGRGRQRNADLISGFSSALEHIPMETGETIESYFARLVNLIQKRKKETD
jgi:hypothetical protein